VYIETRYPAVVNHKEQVEHVRRVGSEYFGESKVSDKDVPLTASEDFSLYLQ